MNRVIRDAQVGATPAFFGNSDTRFVDGEVAEIIRSAEAAAYQRGRHDGAATARSEMATTAQRIESALRTAAVEAHNMRAAVVTEALEAALTVAEYVMGVRPVADPTALANRIQEAIAGLDDEAIVVSVHPGDWDAVSAIVQLPLHISIDRDPTLQPGEARLRGTWSSIDMTRQAAMAIAREVLQ
ncbi:MAG: hypothetical protein GY720_22790 [bacterium]|nr:hypothetical protein [bacterium]